MFRNFGVKHELYLGTDNVPFVKIKAILHWSWDLGRIKLRFNKKDILNLI